MLVGMKYATELSNPNRFHGFVEVVLNERDRYVVEVEPIEGPVPLLERRIIRGNKSSIVNSNIDLETTIMCISISGVCKNKRVARQWSTYAKLCTQN